MTTVSLMLRYAHISMGLLALVSGAGAMTFRKGSRLHRLSGNVFFPAMMIVGASGAIMAVFIKPNLGNLMGGMMAFYLVSTAWLTVIRKPGRTGTFEIAAALLGLTIGATGITFAVQAANAPNGRLEGYPPVFYIIFASIALLGTAFDVRMIVRGGLTGTARTTRHLWRMCMALFMATGSFFFGQPQFFPAAVRQSGLLPIGGLLPLVLLLYWMIRVRLWPRIRKRRGLAVPNYP